MMSGRRPHAHEGSPRKISALGFQSDFDVPAAARRAGGGRLGWMRPRASYTIDRMVVVVAAGSFFSVPIRADFVIKICESSFGGGFLASVVGGSATDKSSEKNRLPTEHEIDLFSADL